MSDLRHPDLRPRDVRRFLNNLRHQIVWDAGTSEGSEWVYASLESGVHRERLLEWLRNKHVPDSADAFFLPEPSDDFTTVTWGDVLLQPEAFFLRGAFQLISKSVDWQLDYRQPSVARFGRWLPERQTTTSLANATTAA